MSVEFEIASDQIDGARDYQEDAYMVNQLGESENGEICSLVIMADGMGGHAAGNVASNMVVATFNKTFQTRFPTNDIADALTESLTRANDQIGASVKETPALRGMGCTMVSAYLQDNKLYWVSVGDSHLYLLRDRELIKQNADHSYGAYLDMMKEQGMEMDEQAGMSRNMLMSAMTGEEISSIDVSETPVKVRPGDRIIVASDGLDTIGAGAIIQYSSWSSTAKECVYALLKAVEDANKINQDNTTLIVIDVKEKVAQPGSVQIDQQKQTSEPVRRVADVTLPDEPPEPRSFKWMVWPLIFLVFGAAGYFAWKEGLVQQGIVLVEKIIEENKPEILPEGEPVLEQQPADSGFVEDEKLAETVVEPADEPEPAYVDRPDVFRDQLRSGGRGPLMIKVPGGTFRMGSPTGMLSADEVPRHEVTVEPFMVSVYEITFAEYDRFAKATGRKKPDSKGWDRKTHPAQKTTNAAPMWSVRKTMISSS